MSYKAFYGQTLIHSTEAGTPKSQMLESAKIVKQMNLADSFTFTVMPFNVGYSLIEKMKAGTVTVYDGTALVFRGRVLSETVGWNNEKQVVCESDTALLNDTVIRPYSYIGTVSGFLQKLITEHNSQKDSSEQFSVGTVTVTDPSGGLIRTSEDYETTWEELNGKLVNELGGYIIVRRSGNTNYIDYLADASVDSGQTIELGKNLLSMSRKMNGAAMATGIIPLGAQDGETGGRLTIASVNGGIDYLLDTEAAADYGKIFKTVVFEDVTDAAKLKTLGEAELEELTATVTTIQLTALDLSRIGRSTDELGFMEYVNVNDAKHNVVGRFLVTKKEWSITTPGADAITLGREFTERITKSEAATGQKTAALQRTAVSAGVMNAAIGTAAGRNGGYIKIKNGSDGKPSEILIMNNEDEASATKIWRWNLQGLSFSGNGGQSYSFSADMSGNVTANKIKTNAVLANHFTAQNLDITGGSMKVTSSSESDSIIEFSYWTGENQKAMVSVRGSGVEVKWIRTINNAVLYRTLLDFHGMVQIFAGAATLANAELSTDGLEFRNSSGTRTAFYKNDGTIVR